MPLEGLYKGNIMKSYWDSTGKFQKQANILQTLLPDSGQCPNVTQNEALDLFRRACNCYYDLYNNGLINKAQQFAAIFRIAGVPSEIRSRRGLSDMLSAETMMAIEARMDQIITDAVMEQFLTDHRLETLMGAK
jgi:hypothetical protein